MDEMLRKSDDRPPTIDRGLPSAVYGSSLGIKVGRHD
jgi:hypothetical protein